MLIDRCVDAGIKKVVVRRVIVPPQEYAGEVWEGSKNVVGEMELGQMRAAQDSLGCSTRAGSAAVQAELSKYTPDIRKGLRKRRWQYQTRDLRRQQSKYMQDADECREATGPVNGLEQ